VSVAVGVVDGLALHGGRGQPDLKLSYQQLGLWVSLSATTVHTHHRQFLLSSVKVDAHFTAPRMVGW